MTADEAVVAVVGALDAADIPHMIVGSLASNFHGVPRATRDADLVVQLTSERLQRLADSLPEGLHLDPQGSFETVTATRRHLITLDGSPFVCELFVLSEDAHDQERFARRQRVILLGAATSVATAEDVIVTKLRWASGAARGKDRDDIRSVLAVQGAALDWAYITRWARQHGTASLLDEIRGSVPPT